MSGYKQVTRSLVSGLFIVASSCLDPYSSTGSGAPRNLVVGGYLNSASGTCEIHLSRAISTGSLEPVPPEADAEVSLVRQDGRLYSLTELTPGDYTGSALDFEEGDSVQLKIATADNVTYQSTFVPVLQAPIIDSVTWESEREGLTIKVSTHNDKPDLYYYWTYSETWNHVAAYQTAVMFAIIDGELTVVPLDEPIYECWTTANSTDILVGRPSTRNDGTFVIGDFPLGTIPWESPKLQSRYSIEVEQRAISRETFEFLKELKKNSENLGSLFDPLPSSPTGNIKCITHPEEITIGYFFASTAQKKRIFLDALLWSRPAGTRSITGNEACALNTVGLKEELYFPISPGVGYPYALTFKGCADCRLNGGTNVRPDFWIW